ncbi:hypothetical protein KSX_07670 [Ktedonospora formicarum]|uniref:DAGKc domain-containing protein n=1 Tax=Ktedonospora formicarum TaxID=2778364 RepID=A0A8J3HZ62_9CHLR|nr:hypothetical protein KSX_07670 [Ktedonospora formicarum]
MINPRAGQNVVRLPEVLAVLAAAGWQPEVALKKYGRQSIELAREASESGSDVLISYGGDGNLNQVINGLMNAKKPEKGVVGVLPGGTANLWAGDIGVPRDPVKAALALIDSEVRHIDVGHVEVEALSFPEGTEDDPHGELRGKLLKRRPGARERQHFLLMAGLGFDAEVMRHAPKPLKYRLGPLAVGLTVAQRLPEHQPFPIELHALGVNGEGDITWQGEALQVIIGNTRRYAMVLETTPDAYIDDGVLDVCIIVAGDPVSTMQQLGSLLVQHKPHTTATKTLQGSHISIKVPASVPMELDGSAVKLKNYLGKEAYRQLGQAEETDQVMVTYRFDALHKALPVAIPCTYNEELFNEPLRHEKMSINKDEQHQASQVAGKREERSQTALQEATERAISKPAHRHANDEEKHRRLGEIRSELTGLMTALFENGRKVTVIGKANYPEKPGSYIIAGTTLDVLTSESKAAAVVVTSNTALFNRDGERIQSSAVEDIEEGVVIVVEGKRNKLGVIKATRVIL